MGNKSKYGNIDELLSSDVKSDANEPELSARKRRPSPALGVMTGDRRPTSFTDGLKAEKQAALDTLKKAQAQFEEEKSHLLQELEQAKNKDGTKIILTMPVTKQNVAFEMCRIDPHLIDVSPENERIQTFLDEISLQDILPSIRKHGQQQPGTVRPKDNGRFELIEGSRRLAAVKLSEQPYLALVGNVPDADVRELGVIENQHQDVSPYEKAKAYLRLIECGEFQNWTQLGAARGISSTHIARYKSCVEIDEIFVRILPSPSDMPLSYGETIARLIKKDEEGLRNQASQLLSTRQEALHNKTELLDVEEIIKRLKSSVRTKAKAPTAKRPVTYKSRNGQVLLKHTISNKGTTKFELTGVEDDTVEKLLKYLTSTLKVESA
ncbi:chromosome partitioning protein ParB [Pseudoalteromonas luteoviolacea]|uniref:Chromosome partitioning protein ParB n=1 Tax=Pseudoalteromonas luteoviolacea TaxID=43657 RepID=A0A1C0TJV1_9GAMM|nr:ParB/RepB/Spo0J family partition protein [Pseudoalteromonas luteoviolacea]MBQ4814045.1 ParB/RepB/Spo0J family partition protein [Pseudoalteromonas luteoviolacea]OCQ18702.1 chromosome partitioning protein ParB [Pseudoalteromonas luteoviolacea]